jgi:nucleotide-binding universal stress UspA family protein
VDLSEPSREALDEAADLARRTGAELDLVFVVVPPPQLATDMLVAPAGAAQAVAEEEARTLARWRADAEARVDHPVSTHQPLASDPAAEIVRHAREHHADLVVVGTHGRTGLRRAVMGSVAERVVRSAPCPVLVARAHA